MCPQTRVCPQTRLIFVALIVMEGCSPASGRLAGKNFSQFVLHMDHSLTSKHSYVPHADICQMVIRLEDRLEGISVDLKQCGFAYAVAGEPVLVRRHDC